MADIRLEVPDENQILEILYDGSEIHQPPPSMSENLTQLARKIDFGLQEKEDATADEKEETEEEKPFQQAHWPFENIRTKIRSAWTEMNVLHDLLQVVKDKRYLILDQVQTPQPESRNHLQYLAIKKSLASAASILLAGVESIRSQSAELNRGRQSTDFHVELLRLRQNWRLKKVGNSIIGDLSYKSAGSSYKQMGIFEVTKSDENELPIPLPLAGALSPVMTKPGASALKVQVSADLEGSAYIFLNIRTDEEDLCSARIQGLSTGSKEVHWQQRLECAQNVLFCKELFNQLAKDAVSLQPPIPHMVVGDQITSTILPGIHLLIGLSYSDPESKKKPTTNGTQSSSSMINGTTSSSSATPGVTKSGHDEVLEHSLHQMLHKAFLSVTSTALPHPVYGHVCVPTKRRFAGPLGTHRDELLQSLESECLLEKIIRQAQHNLLRLRTMFVIDQLASEIKDPLIISHWNLFNSPTQSCVRINIVTQGYDSVLRTTLVIHVYEKTLKCICRDGKVMTLSFEPQELRDLLFIQISQHTVAAVQCFARYMGWSILSSENCIGVGVTEPLGNASAVILASPNGNKLVSVRSGPKTGITVAVSSSPRNDFYPSDVVHDRRWEHL